MWTSYSCPARAITSDEHDSVNHYNCPIVAYYSELLKANNERLNSDNFIMPYIDLNMWDNTVKKLCDALKKYKVRRRAADAALKEGFRPLRKVPCRRPREGRGDN